MTYRVKDVARLTGVSVRALHHYDEIGLLVPKARTEGGYRLYDDQDLLRLQQILLGRALGLSLLRIGQMLDDPKGDQRQALIEQRAALVARAQETRAMIRAVDAAIAVIDAGLGGKEGTIMDRKTWFEGFEPEKYEAEAEARWGDTEAFRESMRRTQSYGPKEWQEYKDENQEILSALELLKQRGVTAESPEAQAIAERHRASIDRWFYPCDQAMHQNLAALYENDPRFAANIDRFGAGLTAYLVRAIRAVGAPSITRA